MFLVYVPVVFVSMYFCATNCLPNSARRMLSRVVSRLFVTVAFTVAKTARYATALRSAYVWEKRLILPTPFVKVLDTLLKVDTKQARLDTSPGHASIRVLTAILTVNGGHDYDIGSVLQDMWLRGDGTRVDVCVNDVLERLGVDGLHHDATVVTRIRYRGHSNTNKRYPSETFSARYTCGLSQVFRFPPYPSSEMVRRGIGVPRIVRANFAEENGAMLYGPETKESAGLRRKFYTDVEDDPCLDKNTVTFVDRLARYQEKKQIVATTSRASSKVLVMCNSSQLPT